MSFRRLARRKTVYLFMAGWMFFLGLLPQGAYGALVSSRETGFECSQRASDLEKINSLLAKEAVAGRLAQLGLKEGEVVSALSRLDDARLHELALRLESVEKGAGDTLLVIVLLVLIFWAFIYFSGYAVKLEPRQKTSTTK